MKPLCRLAIGLSAALLVCGCGTLSDGRRHGADAGAASGWRLVGRGLARAALDPQVWMPLAAAALLQVDDADRDLSDWAVDHAPVFGSRDDAEDARGWTGQALDGAFYLTLAAARPGDATDGWVWPKVRETAIELAAVGAAGATVDGLKDLSGRTRPNGLNDKSFPSSHAARSSVDVALAARNLDTIPMPATARTTAKAALYGIGTASAWSRVEAAGHYPSDVLAGWAVGRFWGVFIDEAFLSPAASPVAVEVLPEPGGMRLGLRWRF